MSTLAVSLLSVVVAFVIALVFGRWAAPIGRHLGLLDFPDSHGGRKLHAAITPLVGGSAVFAGTLAACALTLLLLPTGPWVVQHLAWLAGGLTAMYLIGLADDRFALGAVIRLILSIVALLIVLTYAPDFSIAFMRFSGQSTVLPVEGWGDAFALLCLVGLLNAVNMSDGKNGIVLSQALIWSAVLALRLPEPMLPVLAGAATTLAVMLVFNLRGKLFIGDSGSYVISTLFGLLAIYAYNHDFAVMRADDVAVMFAIPVFDTIRLMTVRVAAGGSPFMGDRNHLHHHLHRDFGWPRGLIAYVALVSVPNFGAVLLPGTGIAWLGVSLVLYAATLVLSRGHRLPSPPT